MVKIRVTQIKEAGNIEKERVIIPIDNDCALGKYILLRTRANDKSILGGAALAFWFPDGDIKAGDVVVLYTKAGKSTKKPIGEKTTHFFYWGLAAAHWAGNDVGAVMGMLSDWSSWRQGGFEEDIYEEPKD